MKRRGRFHGKFNLGSALAAALAGFGVPGCCMGTALAQQPSVWVTMINPEIRYVSWETRQSAVANPAPSKGSQVYVPFGVQISATPSEDLSFDALVRSGYVTTHNVVTDRYGAVSVGDIHTWTDTSTSLTATYKALSWIQPYASLALNLPTGSTMLTDSQRLTLIDSDIVQVPAYGQGFNVAPTVGFNLPINSTSMFNFAAGYTVRGDYRRSTGGMWNGPYITVRPGEVLTLTAGYGYFSGPISFVTAISWSTETRTDWVPYDKPAFGYFKNGETFTANGTLSYAWSNEFSTRFSAIYSYTRRNHVDFVPVDPPSHNFVVEDFNSNSAMVRLAFEAPYRFDDWTITPSFGYVYRDHNAWSVTDGRFIPAKRAWLAGIAANYALTQLISINARAEHTWMHLLANPDKVDSLGVTLVGTGTPAQLTDVWLVTLGVVMKL